MVDPDPEDPVWCHGIVECNTCEHKYVAVWPVGADDLTCSKCGGTDTYREAEE